VRQCTATSYSQSAEAVKRWFNPLPAWLNKLRRLLDEQAITERRRVRELAREIKQQALR